MKAMIQRRPTDYYRASNGLLVATNERVIFLGVAPTDKLESEDAPATIVDAVGLDELRPEIRGADFAERERRTEFDPGVFVDLAAHET